MPNESSSAARYVLTHLLKVVPDSTQLEPFRDQNLNNWRKTGSHALISATSGSIILGVTHREYAATLFAEAQHLLNHASEHRAQLRNYAALTTESSPSWMFVSLYYFSLFIAMAWTRVTNGAVIFLDKKAIQEYCRGANTFPGGGAYKATLSIDAATEAASLEISKLKTSHFHEAVWIAANREAEVAAKWIETLSASRKPTADEFLYIRAFRLFGDIAVDDPLVWPSKLRNAINYRPGFSYRTVIKNNFLKIRSTLSKPAFPNIDSALSHGERAKAQLTRSRDPVASSNQLIDLLISQSLVLEAIVEDSLLSLCAILELDCSAGMLRQRFNNTQCKDSKILSRVPI